MENYSDEKPLNVGSGKDLTIAELAGLIAETVGYQGAIHFDPAKPDGTPQKLLNSSRANRLGWRATVNLKQGLKDYYTSYLVSAGKGQLNSVAAA